MTIGARELPALYASADRASVAAQRTYLWLMRFDLALIVVASILSSFPGLSEDRTACLAYASALVLVGGTILTGVIGASHHNRNWFAGRAVAESVKTLSWRYMMCAEPFLHSLSHSDADRLFSQRLGDVLSAEISISGVLGGPVAAGDQITTRMRTVRAASLDDRMSLYLQDRIQGQREWYAKKSQSNSGWSGKWTFIVALAQLAAAAVAIAVVRYPGAAFNPVGALSASAGCMLAWLQLKQHQDLAHSYGLATHELGLVEIRAAHIASEGDFSAFVADSENAISREHTMWAARRDVAR